MAWFFIPLLPVLRVKFLQQICERFALNGVGRKNFWRLKPGCTERSLPIASEGCATSRWTTSKKLRGLSMCLLQSCFCHNSIGNASRWLYHFCETSVQCNDNIEAVVHKSVIALPEQRHHTTLHVPSLLVASGRVVSP